MGAAKWVLVLTFMLSPGIIICSEQFIQCRDMKNLCPGKQYQTTCSLPNSVLYHRITVDGVNCRRAIEIDFIKANKINEMECAYDNKCGEFCGLLSDSKHDRSIRLNFTATSSLNGAKFECFGQSVSKMFLETCQASLADVPQPPRNVSVLKCSKTLLTWDKPTVVNEQPQNTDLKYEISINSSKGNRITFTAREEFAVLPVGKESNEIVRYNVCVSAVNCIGVSEATCIITALGGDESLVSPELNVSAFNSSAIELTWNHRKNITNEEVCYNIEKDYKVNFHCILGNKLIIPMEKGNLIHAFRVRAITEGITGEWSNPICIVFSVPLPLLFKNYTVHRDFNTTTVTMVVRVQQLAQFVENCRIFPATKIELFNSLATMSVNLDESISEQEVSLHFKTISGVKRTEVTGRVFNHVGVSSETVKHIELVA